jgi:hypothetical protein
MSFRIVAGRGDKRYVEEVQTKGLAMHQQRRAVKLHLGMLRPAN